MRPLALVLVLTLTVPAVAWGPHTEITLAALAVLPDRARLEKRFGDHWARLARDYCWMGDWRESVRPDHYADDYLLFPGTTSHASHMLPEVRQTYAPYFRRALQALRTESPREAARWAGSLLHFVQDSGSPPHTTGIGGALHGKMERWVDESKIHIVGYQPRLLGKSDDEALRGFLGRMDGLAAFSKARALKLRPLVEKVEERVNQPLELECALEVARVSADLLHTLFTLGLRPADRPGAVLRGTLTFTPPAGYVPVPAKVVLEGTTYSTTADEKGRFHFRDLPPGTYRVWGLAPGSQTEKLAEVVLRAGQETTLDRRLAADRVAGNLVRNAAFALSWLAPDRPDAWQRDPVRRGRWASALVRVPVEKTCLVAVTFQEGKRAPLAVRWRSDPSSAQAGRERPLDLDRRDDTGAVVALVTPDRLQKPFEKGVVFLEVLIETDRPPAEVCRHVAVTFR